MFAQPWKWLTDVPRQDFKGGIVTTDSRTQVRSCKTLSESIKHRSLILLFG